ncbi:uncharacterized protein [Ptychodera flava]|uniref:uncharacterized protein isoform X2 n=1 Tax=Ptychodera flava TaxID=63121 RepID=UPI00396A5778
MNARDNVGSDGSGSGKRLGQLDPLGEEDDEVVGGGSGDESDVDDDEYDSAEELFRLKQQEEQNKFEMLCDGVLNSISLVNNSLAEFLDVKDELLKHALPPALLAKLTMVAGKIYRSTTDLNTPVGELVRLVKVYSVPWEEKSAALKKLHADYESKHKQLNIAIRRLQLVDTHSKRIEKEKRIMNWEKLFAKLTSSRGHGRRWKFLIETFRQKAKLGLEYLQQYIDNMDKEDESDSETEDDKKEVQSMMTQSTTEDFKISSDELDLSSDSDGSETPQPTKGVRDDSQLDSSDEDDEEEDGDVEETRHVDGEEGETTSPGKRVTFQEKPDGDDKGGGGEPVYLPAPKPPMEDKQVWTHEPEFDRFLNIRVYRPLQLPQNQLRCMLSYGKIMKKTDAFEDIETEEKETEKDDKPVEPKGKSMIGSKSRPQPGGKASEKESKVPPLELDIPDSDQYHLMTFALPKVESGLETPAGTPDENLGIAVHHGQFEEMLAMTTIDRFDLESLEISTYDVEDEVEELEITPFPLNSLKPTKRDQQKSSKIPLSFYFTKKLKPWTADKETETPTIYEIIKDETGIDVERVDLEDVHTFLQRGPYEDRCLSAMSLRSTTSTSSKQNMMTMEEVEALKHQHTVEMQVLQDEYEVRLNDLARSLQEVQEAQIAALTSGAGVTVIPTMPTEDLGEQIAAPKSAEGKRSLKGSHSPLDGWHAHSPDRLTSPKPPSVKKENRTQPEVKAKPKGRVGYPLPKWGNDLPKDFFDRMKLYEEDKIKNQRALIERTQSEIQEHIERQLAGQHRLAHSAGDRILPMDPSDDVCLPAVFMPSRTGQLYNPRAHHYFHPSGSLGTLRLTQPPSMFQLPPLPDKNKLTAAELFDIRRNFLPKTAEYAMDIPQTPPTQYFSMSQPMTPAPTADHSMPPTADAPPPIQTPPV